MSKSEKPGDYANNPYFDVVTTGGKGRPSAVLNENGVKTVQKLASMGCTTNEILAFIDASYTICHNAKNREKFTSAIERASELSKIRIRQAQYKCLDNGNSAVTIFMSKAVLGMTEGQTAQAPNDMFASFLQEAKKYAELDNEDEQ